MENIAEHQDLFQKLSLIADRHGCQFHGIDIDNKWIDVNCPDSVKVVCAVEMQEALQNDFDERRMKNG